MRVSENLITLISRAFLFVNKGEHFILVLLCKANLEHKEICASDWVSYIQVANPYSLWVFMFYIPDLALCYKKPYSSSLGSMHRRALNNDFGNFMMSHFYPIDNSTGWGKNGSCPIFTPGVSCFYPKLPGIKMGYL